MARVRINRQTRFSAALALVKMSKAQWAKDNGIHRVYLSTILRSKKASGPVSGPAIAKIDRFIESVEKQVQRKAVA